MIFSSIARRATCLAWVACAGFAVADVPSREPGRIDTLLAEIHDKAGIEPTAICDDATFFRRVSLDLIGRVPTTDELKQFLDAPDRADAVDRLLASEEHPRFWSHLWTTMLVGRGERGEVQREVLRSWIERQLSGGEALDQLAFNLITAEGVTSLSGPVNYVVASRGDPVMRLSRAFLSVQLDCAQCHDHPHDRWTNEDYELMRRFFQPTQFREVSGGIAVSDAGTGSAAQKPVFLTGRSPQTSAWRRELGLMVVQSKPFSRAMVNRTWHWLMGRGIVDPVDGLSRDNPASVPDLLEELAADLRGDRFRLAPLIRRICLSQAYQRRPVGNDSSVARDSATEKEILRLFAARTVRPQLPEQWIASVSVVLDRPLPPPDRLADEVRQSLGLGRQATPANDPLQWTSTSQTLIRQLSSDVPAPLRDLESIFWATLARAPTPEESQWVASYPSSEVMFALVHSNEFVMND